MKYDSMRKCSWAKAFFPFFIPGRRTESGAQRDFAPMGRNHSEIAERFGMAG